MPSKLAFKLIFKYGSKGRWRFIVQRNLAVLWPMKMCTFPVEITKRRAQSLRMKMWNAELRIWKELQLFTACSRMQQDYPNYIRGRKSMEYLCNLMNYLCFTTEVWKKHCFPFKNALLFLLPTQYNVENQKKLKVVCTLYGGWGRGWAGELVFALGVSAKAPKVRICPKTFVHDCLDFIWEIKCHFSVLFLILNVFFFSTLWIDRNTMTILGYFVVY